MKLKIESEDYSEGAWLVNETARKYKEMFGIDLDRSKMGSGNPGLRQVAKLILNCLWGRLMMDLSKRKTDTYCNRDQMDALCSRISHQTGHRRVELDLVAPVSDQCYLVKSKGEFSTSSSKTNPFNVQRPRFNLSPGSAAFVASQGRVKLYRELLDPLGERALYNDTDSCIWHYVPGLPNPVFPKAPVFGELTDENYGVPVIGFRSPCSKTYALKFPTLEQCKLLNESEEYTKWHGKIDLTSKKVLELVNQGSMIKCKGFTLKGNEAKNTLTFEQFAKLMKVDGENSVRVPQEKWDRSGNDSVRTSATTKRFSVPVVGNAKRVRLNPDDEFCLQYPWGHDMVPEGSPAYKAARLGLVLDGRIKPKTEKERQEFRDIRAKHA